MRRGAFSRRVIFERGVLFKEDRAFSRKVFFKGKGLAFLKEGACFFGVSGRG